MEMSPQRVRSAEFKTVRKGADPDEVKVFLNDVADELERAQNQSTAMEARARAAVARLQEVSGTAAARRSRSRCRRRIGRRGRNDQSHAAACPAHCRHHRCRGTRRGGQDRRRSQRRIGHHARLHSRDGSPAPRRGASRSPSRSVRPNVPRLLAKSKALMARRDFLEADVEQLELFLTDQRNRLREAATSIVDITERVPGGLGEARAAAAVRVRR